VLASLNHPNIAQIYGIEDRALVMELVEGHTLQGPLSIETSLNYARQIADALEAAKEHHPSRPETGQHSRTPRPTLRSWVPSHDSEQGSRTMLFVGGL
jgi:serine/threonine protein kinase